MNQFNIRSFAMIREILGKKTITMNLNAETLSIKSLCNLLVEKFPDLESYIMSDKEINGSIIFAIDGNRVESTDYDDIIVNHGQELAILPPAGGVH